MFLSAIARPLKIREQWWDGKIGIWQIGEMEYEQKTSKNCLKGTPIWVNRSVDKNILWVYDKQSIASNTWKGPRILPW